MSIYSLSIYLNLISLITTEKISCIYLVPYIGQFAGIAVCYDAVTFLREFIKILIYL